jgi:subtilisin-like proprotein convertase family protein
MRRLIVILTLVGTFAVAGAVDARRNAQATFVSPNVNTALPDGPASDTCIPNATVSSTISLAAGSGNVSDVDVSLRMTHTFADDIRVRLLHTPPGGATTTLMLLGHSGGQADGFGTTTYPAVPDFTLDDEAAMDVPDLTTGGGIVGTYRPKTYSVCPAADPLSGLDGQDAAGTWTLEAGDIQLLDTGTYDYWALDITTTATPTAAKLARFTAAPGERGVVLRWRTSSESETAGFNVYGKAVGREVRLNRALVRAKALGGPAGASYRFVDMSARGTSITYRLESVGLDGSRQTIGIVALTRRLG